MNILVVHFWSTEAQYVSGWAHNHRVVAHNVELMHQLLPRGWRISHRISIDVDQPLSLFPEMSVLIKWMIDLREARVYTDQDVNSVIGSSIIGHDVVYSLQQNDLLTNETGENFFSVLVDMLSCDKRLWNERFGHYRQDGYKYIGYTADNPPRINAAPYRGLFDASEWDTVRDRLRDMEPCLYLKPSRMFSITSYDLRSLGRKTVSEIL